MQKLKLKPDWRHLVAGCRTTLSLCKQTEGSYIFIYFYFSRNWLLIAYILLNLRLYIHYIYI